MVRVYLRQKASLGAGEKKKGAEKQKAMQGGKKKGAKKAIRR